MPQPVWTGKLAFNILAVLLSTLALDLFIADQFSQRSIIEEKAEVSLQLSALRARLEKKITGNLLLVQGTAHFIAITPDLDAETFTRYAREVMADENLLKNLGAAPDYIMRYVYPLEGNRQILGVDYRTLPDQWEQARKARDTDKLVVAGPLELLQGGVGLIGRAPVFTGTGDARKFWGIVSSVIDADRLFSSVGLEDLSGLDIAIRGKDGKGETGDVFFGDAPLFAPAADSLRMPVTFPSGTWIIAARPKAGWGTSHQQTPWFHALLGLLALTLTYAIWRGETSRQELHQAKERYRTLLELLPDGVMLVEPATASPIEFNTAAHEQLGYTREEFAAMDIQQYEARKTPQETAEHMKRISETGRDDFETLHRRKDGSSMDVLVTTKVVETEGKKALLAVFRDITARKLVENALKASEARFKSIFEHANVGIAFTDAQGDLLLINNSFSEMMAYPNEEMIGMNFGVLTHPEDLARESEMFHAVQRSEIDTYRMEKRYVTKSGDVIWGDLAVAILRDDTGNPLNFVGLVIDITERKRVEEALRHAHDEMEQRVRERTADLEQALAELRDAMDKVESANRMKSDFLAAVSHELRTPLNGMQGMLQLLTETGLDEEQREYLFEAQSASQRLLKMVNDVLVITSLEIHRLDTGPVSIQGLIDDIERSFSQKAQAKSLAFETFLDAQCPPVVLLDAHLIRLALSKLTDNAIKFTATGTIRLDVTAQKKDESQVSLQFCVSDTGQGIQQLRIQAVISGMTQADSTYARSHGGIGLGLESARKALALLGGVLHIESTLEQGTTVTVTLQAAYCDEDDLEGCMLQD